MFSATECALLIGCHCLLCGENDFHFEGSYLLYSQRYFIQQFFKFSSLEPKVNK